MPHLIEILNSNVSNDSLILSDDGYTEAGWFNEITWSIKDAKVESFRIERKPSSPHNIFIGRPERGYNTSLDLRTGVFFKNWGYTIFWKDGLTHTEHRFDPKIAVKPDGLTFIVMFLILAIVVVPTAMFFRRRALRK
jgi:hypothetical protein